MDHRRVFLGRVTLTSPTSRSTTYSTMKRRRDDQEETQSTPRKSRRNVPDDGSEDEITSATTPSKTRRTPGKSSLAKEIHHSKLNGTTNGVSTPRSERRVLFKTPTKAPDDTTPSGTPALVRNADRSARRKSARRIIERSLHGEQSDEEVEEEDELARQIFDEGSEDEGQLEQEETAQEDAPTEPPTPKRGRGRPKGSKNRTPSPPPSMLFHEQYFWQNRTGTMKTSNHTLPSHLLLNHDEFFARNQEYVDPHKTEKEFLLDLHSNNFAQWAFELENGFNLCLHGYGSKRALTERFAEFICANSSSTNKKADPKIVIINAYIPGMTIRDVLIPLAKVILPTNHKLPAYQPSNTATTLLNTLAASPPTHPVTIIINSLDTPGSLFRRQANLAILATLASSPHINLVATADTSTFPLLFDLSLRTQFNWLFHDCTTFAPFTGFEIDVVETVNELLGRGGRRIGGRDGVAYVLKSLPENAKGVFRIILAEQLAAADSDDVVAGAEEDDDEMAENGGGARKPDGVGEGVEYRILYHKALEELLCTNEMSFRTLLKEFHDHRMVESKRDIGGTERLVIPFRREDLEALLEELA